MPAVAEIEPGVKRMAKKQAKLPKTTPVRLTDEAIRWARIASGYTGESMAEYVSRVITEHGRLDADRFHTAAIHDKPKGAKG